MNVFEQAAKLVLASNQAIGWMPPNQPTVEEEPFGSIRQVEASPGLTPYFTPLYSSHPNSVCSLFTLSIWYSNEGNDLGCNKMPQQSSYPLLPLVAPEVSCCLLELGV